MSMGKEFIHSFLIFMVEYITAMNSWHKGLVGVLVIVSWSALLLSILCIHIECLLIYSIYSGTSDALEGRGISVKNNTRLMNSVVIKWNAPKSPNGLILLYKIELVRVDMKNVSSEHLFAEFMDF